MEKNIGDWVVHTKSSVVIKKQILNNVDTFKRFKSKGAAKKYVKEQGVEDYKIYKKPIEKNGGV